MKSIIFPKEMDKILKSKLVPTTKIGYYKPHQIYLILDYKHRITHTYIQILHISQIPHHKLPRHLQKNLRPNQVVELIHFKIIYEDTFTEEDENGNLTPKLFN